MRLIRELNPVHSVLWGVVARQAAMDGKAQAIFIRMSPHTRGSTVIGMGGRPRQPKMRQGVP